MHPLKPLAMAPPQFCAGEMVRCPAQVLVVDRPNGPASVLIDTISLLLDREVSVTLVEDHADVLRALDYYCFDLVVVGLESQQPVQLTILPHIRAQDPDTPVIVVGRDLPRLYRQYARTYGVRDVLNLPERAADLKALLARLSILFNFSPKERVS